MLYILDTNVISEAMKATPDHNTVWWMQDHNKELYFNVISIEEVYFGIFKMPDGKRKEHLRAKFDAFVKECADRTLPSMRSRRTSARNWPQRRGRWGVPRQSKREEILSATRLADSGALTKKLAELESCGFIRRYRAYGKKERGALYQLDPVCRDSRRPILAEQRAIANGHR